MRSRGLKKPGFFLNISVGCRSYGRNPVSGKSAIAWDKETGFLPKYFGGDAKIVAETRFLGSGRGAIAWIEKPGFFLNISVGCKSDRKNPGSGKLTLCTQ
ncbi:hypothetical protein [Microcoleus sp. CAWBG58]|uniref:hypothetical protein n=1 Tax=Microcoleus sp. CAWBG58 TaxID=2841651 RepID=UPI0025FAF945|nr:hypothetical protein [Microcoleus sp. CAWBG58]